MSCEIRKEKIALCDLDCLGGLGMGAFGTVFLVRPSQLARWAQPRTLMALKEQEKVGGCEDILMTEVSICKDVLGGPFLGQLLASFQTRQNTYLLTEFYSGGSLQHHITARTVFGGRQMAILAAELSVALAFLHDRAIVHRDVKPDNIMFDGDGHAKVIDFGIAAYDWWGDPAIQEPCGTSIYLAPEMYREPVHYDKMVDWWALGVTLLALVHKVDPVDLFEGPLKSTGQQERGGFLMAPGLTHFRLGMYSQPLKTFIDGLLKEDPANRLGAGGEGEIRQQRLFFVDGILSYFLSQVIKIHQGGEAAFGTVFLVRPSQLARWAQPRTLMALKKQEKVGGCEDVLMTEVSICKDVLGGPFLGQLLASFQTKQNTYLLTEFYSGGSLQHHITARTVFGGRQMAILAAELSVALAFLHDRAIVHRDVKPDNIMFDGDGHAKVIDFGIAAYDWWGDPAIQEPCGTSIYLAPEMYREPVHYDKMVDWWALGVTLLALVYKVDPLDLFEGPLKSTGQQERGGFRMAPGPTHFRLGMYSQPLKTFIDGLLKEDPANRLGEISQQRLFFVDGILSR
ncbi:ribosomal protein S6 kinase alpha-4-like [Babylonia areolata]|uniref:ribosomal protein S6 kinase alpha-4-like n=1 Tax=Babylonia areolata TaxID=304850 RepID=UPI003FD423D9